MTLPDRVDSTQVSASFAQGILTVTIPKAESAGPATSRCRPRAELSGTELSDPI